MLHWLLSPSYPTWNTFMPKNLTPAQLDLRWEAIQLTRPRAPGTNEPMPGSMGRAFFFDPRSVNIKEVNVLGRVNSAECQVQDVYNTQIRNYEISGLRTAKEIWDYVAREKADLLPRGMKAPITDRQDARYWRADRLPKEIFVRLFKE